MSGQKNLQKNNEYYFYENKGQILNQDGKENKNVQYLFLSNGLNVQLKKNGFSYDVYQVEEVAQNNPAKLKLATPETEKKIKYKFHRVENKLVHSNNNS